jgi:chorismate dehydratase
LGGQTVTVRVGHIEFLNCYPLYYGLEKRGMWALADAGTGSGIRPEPFFTLLPGVPTDLNRMLVAGDIDLGPISSIAYARNHRRLLLSRHLSISSFGAVDSIQVVSKGRLKDIRSVALTRQSATSVALLKIILRLRLGLDVDYTYLDGNVTDALGVHDAVLLIGDQGLHALYFPEPDVTTYDLGQLWQEWTGLPMVYAVWAAREEYAYVDREGLLKVEKELVRCMNYGREHQAEVVEGVLRRSRLERPALTRYFDILHYDFPPVYQQGLRRFYELAYEVGELDELPLLRFIDEVV